MYTRFLTTLLAIFSVLCAYQMGLNPSIAASQMYKISSITNDIKSDSMEITISGNAAPAYTVSERFDPYRNWKNNEQLRLGLAFSPSLSCNLLSQVTNKQHQPVPK